jgi:hypothetical protein
MGYEDDGTWSWWIDREIDALEAELQAEVKRKKTA